MRLHANTVLGVLCVGFALILFFVWIPADTETAIVEKARGRLSIGDAMAPAFAAVVFGFSGLLLLLGRKPDDAPRITRDHMVFLGAVLGVAIIGMIVMRWAGPLTVSLLGDGEYRLLRDTAPWKYIGFGLGGFIMTAAIAAIVEGRISRGAVLAGLIAVILIIALYDLPFDDILLPPNGDV